MRRQGVMIDWQMRCGVLLAVAAVVLGSLTGGAGAQEQLVITGTVQFIDGDTMVVAADNGLSIRVNLTRVDQSAYNTLAPGDRVRVVGVVSPDRSELVAETVRGGANIYDN